MTTVSGTGQGTQTSGNLTVSDAAQFNYLAYQITGYSNGQPVYASGTPVGQQNLPSGWQVLGPPYTDPGGSGQTDVAFINTETQQIYIAARGTVTG